MAPRGIATRSLHHHHSMMESSVNRDRSLAPSRQGLWGEVMSHGKLSGALTGRSCAQDATAVQGDVIGGASPRQPRLGMVGCRWYILSILCFRHLLCTNRHRHLSFSPSLAMEIPTRPGRGKGHGCQGHRQALAWLPSSAKRRRHDYVGRRQEFGLRLQEFLAMLSLPCALLPS